MYEPVVMIECSLPGEMTLPEYRRSRRPAAVQRTRLPLRRLALRLAH